MDIGSRIRDLRKSHDITIVALARKVGLTREYLSNLEHNVNTPSLSTLQKICDALEVSMAGFFNADDAALPPEYQELLHNAKSLSPKQLASLNEFLKSLKQ
ncbi:helix-turn-helix domain-containing protein [Lutispora saccharofermentans]|uniref:Helix-turn-helix domain-containing protein n=1 Tax=Lutispora saccharofermentans TaxID=3024236 RepID=A0ABT1NE23_9FIRM|nr:helix-turn-helix transcriptional regulator [Lutispora saccharofermentans]MCQ1529512.1 helix-turn-helix domain-containing protein [Lutispora saccharofermentans]